MAASGQSLNNNFLEEDNGLNGFAEAHLVGQDDTVVLAPGVDEEVEPFKLVLAQSSGVHFSLALGKSALLVSYNQWRQSTPD